MLGLGSGVVYGGSIERTGFVYDFPGATAAFSLRRLASDESYAIRIRETGGNNEKDIGFNSSGDLDTSAISSFCGSNDGVVTKWYDQSGPNHAVQADYDLQPKIYDGSSVIEENSLPAIKFDESSLAMPSSVWEKGDISVFSVLSIRPAGSGTDSVAIQLSPDFINNEWAVVAIGNPPGNNFGSILYTDATLRDKDTGAYTLGTQILSTTVSDVSTQTIDQSIDGSDVSGDVPVPAAVDEMSLGSRREVSSDRAIDGTIQEVIIFSVAKNSTEQSDIESNIDSYYNIPGI